MRAASATALADEARQSGLSPKTALPERLRARHGIVVRVLPTEAMPGGLARTDLDARQFQPAEALDWAFRTFQLAARLALPEAQGQLRRRPRPPRRRAPAAGPFAARRPAPNLAG